MTLRCLRSLKAAVENRDIHLKVFLFDDASTDGTAKQVLAEFPDITIVTGDGNQYWCGGMRGAIAAAGEQDYDFLLWLNDDVDLDHDFLDRLMTAYGDAVSYAGDPDQVVVGAVRNPKTGSTTYSGCRRTSKFHPSKLERIDPDPETIKECDTMNGNCVLFPRSLVDKVGNIGTAYIQQIGDADYGYRCVEAGGRIWIAPGYVGSCEPNTRYLSWDNPNLTFSERWKLLNTPLGLPFRPWFHFMYRYGGPLAVGFLFFSYAKHLSLSLLRRKPE